MPDVKRRLRRLIFGTASGTVLMTAIFVGTASTASAGCIGTFYAYRDAYHQGIIFSSVPANGCIYPGHQDVVDNQTSSWNNFSDSTWYAIGDEWHQNPYAQWHANPWSGSAYIGDYSNDQADAFCVWGCGADGAP